MNTERQIKVRIKTGAKNERIEKVADRYEVSVREKPERNAANARLLTLLARELHVAPERLRIVKGHRSPSKTITLL